MIFFKLLLYWTRSTTGGSGTTQRFVAVDLLIFYILVKTQSTGLHMDALSTPVFYRWTPRSYVIRFELRLWFYWLTNCTLSIWYDVLSQKIFWEPYISSENLSLGINLSVPFVNDNFVRECARSHFERKGYIFYFCIITQVSRSRNILKSIEALDSASLIHCFKMTRP